VLLVCGMASSLLYVNLQHSRPMQWSTTVLHLNRSVSWLPSELRRAAGIPLGIAYEILATAFGVGVWMSAARNRPLQSRRP